MCLRLYLVFSYAGKQRRSTLFRVDVIMYTNTHVCAFSGFLPPNRCGGGFFRNDDATEGIKSLLETLKGSEDNEKEGEIGKVARQHRYPCDFKRGMSTIDKFQPPSAQVRHSTVHPHQHQNILEASLPCLLALLHFCWSTLLSSFPAALLLCCSGWRLKTHEDVKHFPRQGTY